jgi:hypothetical protein
VVPPHQRERWLRLTAVERHPGQLDGFGGMQAAWGPLELTDGGCGFLAFLNNASDVIDNPCP